MVLPGEDQFTTAQSNSDQAIVTVIGAAFDRGLQPLRSVQCNRFGTNEDIAGPIGSFGSGKRPQTTCHSTGVHLARNEVPLAKQAGNRSRTRGLIDLVRSSGLNQCSIGHHHQVLRGAECFLPIVGDHQHRGPHRAKNLKKFFTNAATQLGVETGKRFIEQQEIGSRCEGTRKRHSLLLTS